MVYCEMVRGRGQVDTVIVFVMPCLWGGILRIVARLIDIRRYRSFRFSDSKSL